MRDFLAEALDLHANSIVLDGHVDTPQRFVDQNWDWVGMPLGLGQLSAETAQAGGVHGCFFAAWTRPVELPDGPTQRVRQLIASVHDQAHKYPDALSICTTSSEVRKARASGRFAAMIGVEGGHAIENHLELLKEFYEGGARYMTLTWANSTDWCGSSGDEGSARGLTGFGRSVVQEMNRLGMVVDISHVSNPAFWDVLDASAVPVIASHSSSRTLCHAVRNLTDDMAIALARRGGVIMVNFYAAFLSDEWQALYAAQRTEVEQALRPFRDACSERGVSSSFFSELGVIRDYARRLPSVPFSVLVDHFDYLLKLVGPDHVGIGSDFDGIALSVEGMESAADLPTLTAALLERGWAPNDLKGMLGENLLRVLTTSQDFAQ